jgi:hypothetical protein
MYHHMIDSHTCIVEIGKNVKVHNDPVINARFQVQSGKMTKIGDTRARVSGSNRDQYVNFQYNR